MKHFITKTYSFSLTLFERAESSDFLPNSHQLAFVHVAKEGFYYFHRPNELAVVLHVSMYLLVMLVLNVNVPDLFETINKFCSSVERQKWFLFLNFNLRNRLVLLPIELILIDPPSIY